MPCHVKSDEELYDVHDFGNIDDVNAWVCKGLSCDGPHSYITDNEIYPIYGPMNLYNYIDNIKYDLQTMLKTDLEMVKLHLSAGYNLQMGCRCCFEQHEIWLCYFEPDVFKIVVDHLCGYEQLYKTYEEVIRCGSKKNHRDIYMKERMKRCPHILSDLIESECFDKIEYERILGEIHSTDKKNIIIYEVYPTDKNFSFYIESLKKGKIDINGAFTCIMYIIHDEYRVRGKITESKILEIAFLCLRLGASIHLRNKITLNSYYKRNLHLLPVIENRGRIMYLDDGFINISMHEIFNIIRKDKKIDIGMASIVIKLLEWDTSAKKVQGLFRIHFSRKEANNLRILPENLFDEEFGLTRRKMLKIDESFVFEKIKMGRRISNPLKNKGETNLKPMLPGQ